MTSPAFDPSSVYGTLPENTIRILTLQPGRFKDKLHIRLKLLKFDTRDATFAPRYEAISYAWGEPPSTRYISCDGTSIPIRQNLFDALRHIRYSDKPRKLWIDALCINQHDNAEKATQIPLMKYIYASALKVIMWLGIEDSSTVRGLELVRHAALCARIEDLKHVVPNLKEEPWSDEQNIARGFPSRFGADGDGLRPVCSLLSNSYFSRVWIIQETVYATSAVLTLGRYHLDFQDFLNGIRFFLAKHYSFSVRSYNILVQFMIFTSLARVITEDLNSKYFNLVLHWLSRGNSVLQTLGTRCLPCWA